MYQKPEPKIRIKVKKTEEEEEVSNYVFVDIRKDDIGNAMLVTEEENPEPFTANLQYEDPNYYFTKDKTHYEFLKNDLKTRVLYPLHIFQDQQIDSSEKQYETLKVKCDRSYQKHQAGKTEKNIEVEIRVYTQDAAEKNMNGMNAVLVDTQLNYLYVFADLDRLAIKDELVELKAEHYIYMFNKENAKQIINFLQLTKPQTFCVRCAIQT